MNKRELHNSYREFFLLTVLSIIFSILLIGNSDARIASLNVDDHPVIFSNFLNNPSQYTNDQLSVYAPPMTYASVMNLAVWILFKYGNLDPKISSYVILVLQSVLMILSIWAVVGFFSESFFLRMLVPLVTYSSNCWANNLAWFPNFLSVPYPGQFVIPVILFAIACLLRNWWKMALSLLLISSIIHPSYGFYSLVLCSFYLLFSWKDESFRALFARQLGLLSILSISLVVGMNALKVIPPGDLMSVREALPSLLINPHIKPWSHPDFWSWALPTFICTMVFSGWVALTPKFSSEGKRLYWASVTVSLLFLGFHLIGVFFKIPILMQVIPLRVTFITSLIFTIITIYYCGLTLSEGDLPKKIATAGILGFLTVHEHGFPIFLALPLMALAYNNPKLQRLAVLFAGLAVLIYPLTGRPLRMMGLDAAIPMARYLFIPGGGCDNRQFLFVLLAAVLLAVVTSKYSIGKALSVFAVAAFLLVRSSVLGWETYRGEPASLLNAQQWAKENTEAEAVFIVGGRSWRGISERRAIFANRLAFRPEAIIRTRKTFDFGEKIQAFYEQIGKNDYQDLNENEVQLFQKTFGGDFFVRERKGASLPFKIAYQNEHFVIYDLKKG